MTLSNAFALFDARLENLAREVRRTGLALEDVPDGDEPAVVDALRAHLGTLDEQLRSAGEARASEGRSVAEVAADCQQCINRMSRCLHGELMTFDNLAEVSRVGAERGGAWRRWTAVVVEALERSAAALADAADALLSCWREIADRISREPVTPI